MAYPISGTINADDVVTESGTQTLTNKTLTNPTINFTDKSIVQNVSCRAHLSTNQLNLTNNTQTLVQLDTEDYDIGSDFNTSTYKFTAPVNGYYLLIGQIGFTPTIADKRYLGFIRINGGDNLAIGTSANGANTSSTYVTMTTISYLAANDYIQLYAESESGTNTVDVASGVNTYLAAHLITQ